MTDDSDGEPSTGKIAAHTIRLVAKIVEKRLAAGAEPDELVAELHQLAETFDE